MPRPADRFRKDAAKLRALADWLEADLEAGTTADDAQPSDSRVALDYFRLAAELDRRAVEARDFALI